MERMNRPLDFTLDHLPMLMMPNVCRTAQAFKVKMERSVLGNHDLSFAAFSTLLIVWNREPIETREIAGSQGITRATVTSNVTLLENRGLVTRRTRQDDRRLVLVELTPEGRKLIEALSPNFTRVERQVASRLTAKEQQTLTRLLTKILAGMREDDEAFGERLASQTSGDQQEPSRVPSARLSSSYRPHLQGLRPIVRAEQRAVRDIQQEHIGN